MKILDEWLKKQSITLRERMSPNYYMGLEDGCKATLEWISQQIHLCNSSLEDIDNIIRQELEQQ